MVSFNFEFNTNKSANQSPTPQFTSTQTLSPTRTDQFDLAPLDSLIASGPSSRPDSPATPPPTPLSASQLPSTDLETSELMLELTRAKLERAAQGQLAGRRAAGLRELVLLSNAFVGALAPDWTRREREREIAAQRKMEEEKWLDGILEEMSVEDEDDEEEAYVEISYVDEREAHDSGYLDHDHNQLDGQRSRVKQSTSSLNPIPETSDVLDNLDSIEKDDDPGRDKVQGEVHDQMVTQPDSISHTPGPSKSPPIPVPTSPTRTSANLYSLDDCCASETPPSDPPPLTPDCSPRDQPSELLGSSLDSFELPDHIGLDRLDWLHHNGHKRQGLFSVQPSAASVSDGSGLPKLELDTTPHDSLALGPFSRASSQEEDDDFADRMLGTSLVPRSATASPSPQWVAPPPSRSLSLPPLNRIKTETQTPHPIPSFQSGIVTLWDCVDFGKHAPPIPYFTPSAAGQDRARSLPSSPERGRGKIEPSHAQWQGQRSVHGRVGNTHEEEVEMAVRTLPEFPPPVVLGEEDRMGRSPWRARSMSPEVAARRGWASLSQSLGSE